MRKRVLSLLLAIMMVFQVFGINTYADDSKQTNEASENVLALGSGHSGAIDSDGNLWMWGKNDNGQLGNGSIKASNSPVKVKNLENVTSVAVGETHSAAITSDGKLWTWGDKSSGMLGYKEKLFVSDNKLPTQIITTEVFEKVVLGNAFSAAITKDGKLYTWGKNGSGQLGNNSTTSGTLPNVVLENVKDISLGKDFALAITNDGKLYGWGTNYYGQVGNGNGGQFDSKEIVPVEINFDAKIVCAMAGDNNSAALDENGNLYVWGDNFKNQIGNPDLKMFDKQMTPYKALSDVKEFSLAPANVAAIKNDNSLWVW